MAITAQYDPEADALYVRLRDGERDRAIEIDDALYVDVDAEGRALGIEILYPELGMDLEAVASRFQLHDQLPAIVAAIADAHAPGITPTVTAPDHLVSTSITTYAVEGTVRAGTVAVQSAETRADPVICA
ncbi:MAG TPA: DUF2283 domain-containing protein [Capillimicrobium sp.]|nr:DUF2283 domain-containing protein [Capillimicrobium sp.]